MVGAKDEASNCNESESEATKADSQRSRFTHPSAKQVTRRTGDNDQGRRIKRHRRRAGVEIGENQCASLTVVEVLEPEPVLGDPKWVAHLKEKKKKQIKKKCTADERPSRRGGHGSQEVRKIKTKQKSGRKCTAEGHADSPENGRQVESCGPAKISLQTQATQYGKAEPTDLDPS